MLVEQGCRAEDRPWHDSLGSRYEA
jgi:hypothetical protein